MARLDTSRSATPSASLGAATTFVVRYKKWFMGAAAVLTILVVSLIIWGPEMGFPTTVSTVQSSGDSPVELEREPYAR